MASDEGFFLNFVCEDCKFTGSRLVLKLPRNSLCYPVTLVSRFEMVDEENIEGLMGKSEEWHGVLEERFQKVDK